MFDFLLSLSCFYQILSFQIETSSSMFWPSEVWPWKHVKILGYQRPHSTTSSLIIVSGSVVMGGQEKQVIEEY